MKEKIIKMIQDKIRELENDIDNDTSRFNNHIELEIRNAEYSSSIGVLEDLLDDIKTM